MEGYSVGENKDFCFYSSLLGTLENPLNPENIGMSKTA